MRVKGNEDAKKIILSLQGIMHNMLTWKKL